MRRATPLLLLVAGIAGCGGGSPVSPTAPAPLSLQAGSYILRIFTTAGNLPAQNGVTPAAFVCLGIGPRPSSEAVSVPVTIAPEGNAWGVRAGGATLQLRLEEQPGSLYGSIEGQASQGRVTVTIGTSPQHLAPATVSGAAAGASFAGEIGGNVTFSEGAGTYSCSTNGWTLVRQ